MKTFVKQPRWHGRVSLNYRSKFVKAIANRNFRSHKTAIRVPQVSTRRISLTARFPLMYITQAGILKCPNAPGGGALGRTLESKSGPPDSQAMSNWNVQWTNRAGGGAIDLEILKRKSWPGITAHFVRIAAPVTYDFKLSSSVNFVALHDLYRVDGETLVSGLPPSSAKDLRNKLAFIPAGCDIEGWTKIEKPASIVIVMLDQSAPNARTVDLAQLAPRIDFDDPMLRSVMLRFQAVLDDPALDVPGYAETLTELLTFELVRVTGGQQHPPLSQTGLTTGQMRLLTEYMDTHLDEKLTVSALAALVNLTQFHFIRAFKQAVGVPPHQFMIRRRVDRARELLAERQTSIADVAHRTGFGSPLQMTRAFRRIVGATPSAVRRGN